MPLLAAYPLRAWRDAPFFPTPPNALSALPGVLTQPPASVLDAGCGLGHGLAALHAVWPQARLHGVESGAALAWMARRRCRRFPCIVGGDMWAADWSAHDLVYAFQRPDNMGRVHAKAQREMAPGSWLVSLEFAVPGVPAAARLTCPDGRDLWVYRTPADPTREAANASTAAGAGR